MVILKTSKIQPAILVSVSAFWFVVPCLEPVRSGFDQQGNAFFHMSAAAAFLLGLMPPSLTRFRYVYVATALIISLASLVFVITAAGLLRSFFLDSEKDFTKGCFAIAATTTLLLPVFLSFRLLNRHRQSNQ